MDASIITAGIAAVAAVAGAGFAYRASAQANRITDKKVDAEAFERSRQIYEKALADADKQLDRLRAQQDRMVDQLTKVNEQLAKEQDLSSTLRAQIRALEIQMETMQEIVATLRAQLSMTQQSAGIRAAEPRV